MLIKIHTFSFQKIYSKMSSRKWRPFCLGLNELTHWGRDNMAAIFQTTFSNAFALMKMYQVRNVKIWILTALLIIFNALWFTAISAWYVEWQHWFMEASELQQQSVVSSATRCYECCSLGIINRTDTQLRGISITLCTSNSNLHRFW